MAYGAGRSDGGLSRACGCGWQLVADLVAAGGKAENFVYGGDFAENFRDKLGIIDKKRVMRWFDVVWQLQI